jgi:NADPH:quinone reductase-like Zn-dependent oxidoreductase
VELVKSIGADEVIDYTREDFSKRAQKFDVVLDTVGNRSLSDLRHALTKDGTLLLVAGTKGKWIRLLALMLKAVITSPFVHDKLLPVMANMTTSDLDELAGLFEAGKLAPVIDRTYPLSDCAQAIDYVEEGHARGKVVVTV